MFAWDKGLSYRCGYTSLRTSSIQKPSRKLTGFFTQKTDIYNFA